MGRKRSRRRGGPGGRGAGRGPGPVGPNAPCPCGSGEKYKRCCLPRDRAEARARAAQEAPGQGGPSLPGPSLSPRRRAALQRLIGELQAQRRARAALEGEATRAAARLGEAARARIVEGALPEEGRAVLGDAARALVALGARLAAGLEDGPLYSFWYALLGHTLWPPRFRAWREGALAELIPARQLALLPREGDGAPLGLWRIARTRTLGAMVAEDWAGWHEREATDLGAEDGVEDGDELDDEPRLPRELSAVPWPVIPLGGDRLSREERGTGDGTAERGQGAERPTPEGPAERGFVGWRVVRRGTPVFFALVDLRAGELDQLALALGGPDRLRGLDAAARELALLDATVALLLGPPGGAPSGTSEPPGGA